MQRDSQRMIILKFIKLYYNIFGVHFYMFIKINVRNVRYTNIYDKLVYILYAILNYYKRKTILNGIRVNMF